jgi:alpha-tubulin suppressor-like RCC1 family protein
MNIAAKSLKNCLRFSDVCVRILISAILVISVFSKPPQPTSAASSFPDVQSLAGSPAASKMVQIALGGSHSCALTPEGGVVCWGANWSGQLGNGSNADSAAPVPVSGLRSGVMGISLGGFRTCALTDHGTVYCWGNYAVDLSGSALTPVKINGLGDEVIQVAVGENHTCALTLSGRVLCWGFNTYGGLGNGTTTDSTVPVTAISSGAVHIAVNEASSCAVMTDGGVKCWGQGGFGQLGNGITQSGYYSTVPVSVLKTDGSLLAGATRVGLGITFGCALVGDQVQCWGKNRFGQLGIGSYDLSTHAYAGAVLNQAGGAALSGVDQLAVGDEHACAHLTSGNMQCWGHNHFGQLGNGAALAPDDDPVTKVTSPVTVLDSTGAAPLSGVAYLTTGGNHSCVFTSWENPSPFACWGINAYGQLGAGATSDGSSLPLAVSDISSFGQGPAFGQVVTGGAHTCTMTGGDGVKCWGDNTYGQLGNGSTVDSLEPVLVAGKVSGVKAIALGLEHSCAILPWGRLVCWGRNQAGQLGNGGKQNGLIPAPVAMGNVTVVDVAAGSDHTCALTLSGSVYCWGANDQGQIGNGGTTEQLTPVQVIASGASRIALGAKTSCALMTGGGVKCWGLGSVGQLGDGSSGASYYQPAPVDVLLSAGHPLAGATQIALGTDFACALVNRGVECWGQNQSGQLGRGQVSPFQAYAAPVLVEAGGMALGMVNQISAGGAHVCAHQYTNRLKCWGKDEYGQLGDGSSGSGMISSLPHAVLDHYEAHASTPPYLEGALQVSAGGNHTCAYFGRSEVNPYRCWGSNTDGQLGNGSTVTSVYPNMIKDMLAFSPPPVKKIASGYGYTCALTPAGAVKCWGQNIEGQLGNGTNIDSNQPVQVTGLESGVISLAVGDYHVCALTAEGGVKCWGDNHLGQLGNGSNADQNTPVDVVGISSGAAAISAGWSHTCALMTGGTVKCWGANGSGELGNGSSQDSNVPVDVSGLDGMVEVVAGGAQTCALTSVGGVKCWGSRIYSVSYYPEDVAGLASGITDLSLGNMHACALSAQGGVKCWGRNDHGQVGDGTATLRETPVDVVGLTSGVSSISAGAISTCAITVTGVQCWGNNSNGQLGDGSTETRLTPVSVPALSGGINGGVTFIDAGSVHVCAIVTSLAPLRCWGDNSYGQFGDGTQASSLVPVSSKWLTVDGLVEDQKPAIIRLPEASAVVVIPPQAVSEPQVVTVTQLTDPPAVGSNMTVLPGSAFELDEKQPVHAWVYFDYPFGDPLAAGQLSAAGIEAEWNLYFYQDGTWQPVLPCTGCYLDTVNHRLVANLNQPGVYVVMESLIRKIFLPMARR